MSLTFVGSGSLTKTVLRDKHLYEIRSVTDYTGSRMSELFYSQVERDIIIDKFNIIYDKLLSLYIIIF